MSEEWDEKEEDADAGELPELDDDGDDENFGDEDDDLPGGQSFGGEDDGI